MSVHSNYHIQRLTTQVAGQMARHFTTNFVNLSTSCDRHWNLLTILKGLPYKFVVHTDSKGFSEATPEILEAVRRMSWAGRHFVSDEGFKEFNELLAVGYLEKNKMGVSFLQHYQISTS